MASELERAGSKQQLELDLGCDNQKKRALDKGNINDVCVSFTLALFCFKNQPEILGQVETKLSEWIAFSDTP